MPPSPRHSTSTAKPAKIKIKALRPASRTLATPSVNLLSLLSAGAPPVKIPARPLIGVIEGTGIGSQVIAGALRVLAAVEQVSGRKFELRHGGLVGEAAEKKFGVSLPVSTEKFFREIFADGGAVLNGPGGGRFVYDLRRRLDLFCKFAPVRPWRQISNRTFDRVDLLMVRDNVGGVYQGAEKIRQTRAGKVVEHRFTYTEAQVRRLAEVAARAAAARRGKMHVIIKDGGIPAMSELWREVSVAVAKAHGVSAAFMNVDLAAYELIRLPEQFDVMLTPNLFGDILVDITGALLGSRGVTFSGNFDGAGHGVYQTNHGCAHDLAGADVANPAGQILSLAMLLRESFGLAAEAALMESALASLWSQGCRTADVAERGQRVVGTQKFCQRVSEEILNRAEKRSR